MGISVELLNKIAISHQGNIHHLGKMNVTTNSRKEIENGLFIPIVGERFDAHDFLEDAIQAGAVAAIWQKDHPIKEAIPAEFALFFVEDTTKALQQLATERRREVGATIVAITGSNGKTTTKDMVAGVISTCFKTQKTAGNLNNHIGLPLTLLSLEDDCEACVVEMGMNHFGEIEVLSQIAEPDIAVITNIGESHIEFLGSREGIAQAKMEITEGLTSDGRLIVDGDEPLLSEMILKKPELSVLSCGFGTDNDWVISQYQLEEVGSTFTVNGAAFHIPVMGRHNVKNATYAVVIAHLLKIPEEKIQEAFAHMTITGMRLETSKGLNESLLINDAYNASPTSMKAAIETLANLPGFTRKVAILGDMYELGSDEKALHESVADALSDDITDLVTVGEKAEWIAEAARKRHENIKIQTFTTKADAIEYLETLTSPKTAMLFKASRLAELETLVTTLKGGNVS